MKTAFAARIRALYAERPYFLQLYLIVLLCLYVDENLGDGMDVRTMGE
jgi:hypothetical protein